MIVTLVLNRPRGNTHVQVNTSTHPTEVFLVTWLLSTLFPLQTIKYMEYIYTVKYKAQV